MGAAALTAAIAVVLAGDKAVYVDIAAGTPVRTVALPGRGAAIFAAPDGRVLVPLEGEDATAAVASSGTAEKWPGRLFPLFSSDYDRMTVVLPGMLVTLSYPERVPLERVPLEGVEGARRSACSRDGRLVAVIPSGSGARSLVWVAASEGGTARAVELPQAASLVALARDGLVAVVAGRSVLMPVVLGEPGPRPALEVGAEVRALCVSPSGREMLAGLALGAGGEVLGVRVDAAGREVLQERFRTPLPDPVVALAADEDLVAAVGGDRLVVLAKGGRRVARTVAVPGASDVALLPRLAKSTVPKWGDVPRP